jgi:protocatechuate 3,4-dioxygenase beta subunit
MHDTPSCQTVGPGAIVFEATVERIETKSLPPVQLRDLLLNGASERLTHLRDLRAVRGTPQDVLVTRIFGDEDCSFQFRVGQRYLIVAARRDDGRLAATITTRPVESSTEARARTIEEFRTGRLLGSVAMPERWTEWGIDYEPVPEALITLRGPALTRTTRTDAGGNYGFTNLPWGAYTIQVDLPAWTSFLRPLEPQQVALPAEVACAEVEFTAQTRSLLEGTVVDERGQPAAGIPVVVHPADFEDARGEGNGPGFGLLTDTNGRYQFSNLPPARYVVGVNTSGEPSPRYPYKEAYAEVQGEAVIRVGLGVRATPDQLHLTPTNSRTVTGVVLSANGNPVVGADVSLWWTTERGYSRREFR